MRIFPHITVLLLAAAAVIGCPAAATAADLEGCLECHRYRGLARVEPSTGELRLFYVDPNYNQRELGPHARLKCTDCHDRNNVEVVPHRKQAPVDCSSSCHFGSQQDVERSFGHQRIAEMLDGSVHTSGVLDQSNELLGRPLRPGQSRCLLCHDEPTFRLTGQNWAANEAQVGRCNNCHVSDVQPKVDTRLYYWHVMARVRPERRSQDTVRMCAVCHNDPKIQEQFKLPDAVASYLTSFHGKAMLLGDQRTANCLDCHVGQAGSVHAMLSRTQPDSPISKGLEADTCRSPKCHALAGKRVSSAAVHLELATSRGVELFIACLFILMILTTFGPSLAITALEMLGIAVGRHDPKHHVYRQRAKQLLAHPLGAATLRRFTPAQRVQHWVLVASFVTLAATGFPMKFADRAWAGWVVSTMGGLGVARLVHRVAAVVLLTGIAFHLAYVAVYVIRRKRQQGGSIIGIVLNLPMVMNLADMKGFMQLMAYMMFLRKERPKSGRFSPEEKFEYFGVLWGSCLLGLTGVLMWANSWTTLHLSGRVLTVASVIHTFEAFLALLHVGIVHMVTVIFAPDVFPCSPAMFTGNTPTHELAERHANMIEAAEQLLEGPPAEK